MKSGRRLYSSGHRRAARAHTFFTLLVLFALAGCAGLPAPAPDAAATSRHDEVERLLQEHLPLSALALIGDPQRAIDPESRADLRRQQVRALFAAARYADAREACGSLAGEAPAALDWRPLCWEVALEGAADRQAAAGAVGAEIDALLAAGPRDFSRLQAAWRGQRARRDYAAADALLDAWVDAAQSPDQRRTASGALLEATIATRDFIRARYLARRYLALTPDARLADRVVHRILVDLELPGLAAAREVLDLPAGPAPSWRIALALAEWGLDHGATDAEVAALLASARAGLAPAAMETAPSPLGPAARDWLWRRAAGRLAEAEARHALARGDAMAALAHLDAAPLSDPPSAARAALRGAVLETLGRPGEAIAAFVDALTAGASMDAELRLSALLSREHGVDGAPREWWLTRTPGPAFDDVTAAAGLVGISAQRVAWGDPDGDGDPDLLADGRAWLNDGQGRFTPLPGLPAAAADVTGGLWADVDGDGRDDLLLTGRETNRLLLNRYGRWEPRLLPGTQPRTEAAAFADVDGDGDLDLYLANGERGGTRRGLCVPDALLLNDGQGGFSDASAVAGIVTETPLCGRGVTWADVDGDGRPDAVVANYRLQPNLAWLNRGGGRFTESGAAWGVRGENTGGAFGHSIAVVAGDLDGDGREDLVVSNLAHPRYIEFSDLTGLFLSGAGRPPPYVERRAAAGLHYEESTAAVALADVDNDGDLDLFHTAIYPGHRSRLYVNDGAGNLVDRSWSAGVRVENGWGAAFADVDGDGALDLAVASGDGLRLLKNRGGGRWLRVVIDDPACVRDGTGSRVTLRQGKRTQLRVMRVGRGTGSQDQAGVHFGLGDAVGPIEVVAETPCGALLSGRFTEVGRTVTLHGPR